MSAAHCRILRFLETVFVARDYVVSSKRMYYNTSSHTLQVRIDERDGGKVLAFVAAPTVRDTDDIEQVESAIMDTEATGLYYCHAAKSHGSGIVGTELLKGVVKHMAKSGYTRLIVVADVLTTQATKFLYTSSIDYTYFSAAEASVLSTRVHAFAPRAMRKCIDPEDTPGLLPYDLHDPLVKMYGYRKGDIITITEYNTTSGYSDSCYKVTDDG